MRVAAVALLGLVLRAAPEPPAAADVEVFTREGCARCAAARAFLDRLAQERPGLRVRYLDVVRQREALERLAALSAAHGGAPGVPSFLVGDRLLVGFDREETTGAALLALLQGALGSAEGAAVCAPEALGRCSAETADPESVEAPVLGRISARSLGLPVFTIALGLLDGFNPCAMWVLLFLLSLLVNLKSRGKMLAVAGTFVAVSGAFYFLFMAAWLNVFLLVGLSRGAQVVLGLVALAVGGINVKDFFAWGRGVSLSIPESARPSIYARVRRVLQAPTSWQAVGGAVALAMLVNTVEALCTAGLPVAYTSVLASRHLPAWRYYGYLALYNLAYVADDTLMLALAVITLRQTKLQERGGRALKLLSGLAMLGLGALLLLAPGWLAF
jgi:glutaredoxin